MGKVVERSERPNFNKKSATSIKALGEMGHKGHAPTSTHLRQLAWWLLFDLAF
jgi:hypothetical protein